MAALRYRNFLRLCEEWPLDKSKAGRDLGAVVRQKIAEAFKQGETSDIDTKECDRIYNSLRKINSNHYKHRYNRSQNMGCTGLTLEQCRTVLSNEGVEVLHSEEKSFFTSVKKTFGRVDKKINDS